MCQIATKYPRGSFKPTGGGAILLNLLFIFSGDLPWPTVRCRKWRASLQLQNRIYRCLDYEGHDQAEHTPLALWSEE